MPASHHVPGEDRSRWMKQLCVSLDAETLSEIDKAAEAKGLNRSQWVRERIEWALMMEAEQCL